MKTIGVCLLLITLGVMRINGNEIPPELKHMVVGVREKCHRETGVDIEHVDRTVEGYFHPSELLGCYFSCVFNTFELVNIKELVKEDGNDYNLYILDHDGHLDFDKVIPRIPESFKEHGADMIAKCRHITGSNPCESALNIVQCFQKANPEKYFVI